MPNTADEGAELDVVVWLKPRATNDEIERALAAHESLLPYQRVAAESNVAGLLEPRDADLALLKDFAVQYGLTVRDVSPDGRALLHGHIRDMNRAFDVKLKTVEIHGQQYHYNDTDFSLPETLDNVVEGIVGLDTLPVMSVPGASMELRAGEHFGYRAVSPLKIAEWYGFPSKLAGRGQHIALIEFGGGFHQTDMEQYFRARGLPVPNIREQVVERASRVAAPKATLDRFLDMWNDRDASFTKTMDEMGKEFDLALATLEVTLDIQLAGTLANAATIDVYYAAWDALGFVTAMERAIATKPAAIAVSWGATEAYWMEHGLRAIDPVLRLARANGITVFCASGDEGSRGTCTEDEAQGMAHVMFPASSPHVVSCGGTQLSRSGDAGFDDERVWNDPRFHGLRAASGGGVSGYFAKPAYQDGVRIPSVKDISGKVWVAERWKNQPNHVGRGVPDVAANAGFESAYEMVLGGRQTLGGGTSAAAPLWAALTACLAQGLGIPTGWMQAYIYRFGGKAPLVKVTQGSNRVSEHIVGFDASAGWNLCAGWGRPRGTAWLEQLKVGDRRRSSHTAPAVPVHKERRVSL